MSAFGGKADIERIWSRCLLLTQSGHRVACRSGPRVLAFHSLLRSWPGAAYAAARVHHTFWLCRRMAAIPVIGYLSFRSANESASVEAAFREGLSEIGYSDGRSVHIAFRWAEGQRER